MTNKNQISKNNSLIDNKLSQKFLDNIIAHIESAKSHVASYTNSTLVMLYWNVGSLINSEILNNTRAEYGEQILPHLAKELTLLYGNGFDRPNLSRMVKFSKLYSKEICVTLSHQLSWSHIIKLIAIEDGLKRDFYVEMCRLERWSVRILRQKIDTMLFERSAIAKKPEFVIKNEIKKLQSGDLNNPDLYLQDPYILSFLKCKKISSELDLEQAILDELQLVYTRVWVRFLFCSKTEKNEYGK